MILGMPQSPTMMQPPVPQQPAQPPLGGQPAPTSPLVQALLSGQGGQAPQPQSSPLSGINPLMLQQLMQQQKPEPGTVGPSYTGANGPYGNQTPGGLAVGGGSQSYAGY